MELSADFIENLNVDREKVVKTISEELSIPPSKVTATINLLEEDNSIPFISRYRKEVTGFLDETQVRDISHRFISLENLETRRIVIIQNIFMKGKLTEELYENINKAGSLVELEALYAPYKTKKKTRAMIAIEKGLEELADLMIDVEDIKNRAKEFVDPEKGVETVEDALQGAMDILAERVAHEIDNRRLIKDYILENALLIVKGRNEEIKEKSVYNMYYDYQEALKNIKPHRILAINRGENEGELDVTVDIDEVKCDQVLLNIYRIKNNYFREAIEDGNSRLLMPSVIREIRGDYTDDADVHGIGVFSKNLGSLLMQPPIKKTRILAIDPGIRTGSKGVGLDETGKYLGSFLFYQQRKDAAKDLILKAIDNYSPELIAIGNGTGSHDVQTVVAELISENNLSLQYTVVDEDGASVYSASDIARDEFPELDLTIRGAISIGRRLQDPLAELVKIDPKSIGVGLYQHDLNQNKLADALDEVVESVVNNVGVNINTASYSLLKYVSGLSVATAKRVVQFRETNGIIKSREDIRKVDGIGDKSFEQAAGFLKVPESDNPLDNTWVHPENYEVALEIYNLMQKNVSVDANVKEELSKKHFVSTVVIDDIIKELKKPNRDPRDDYPKPILQKGVLTFEDLSTGMRVTGKIKNVVDFGAFVDIGIKESGLIHISQISNQYIKSPHDVLKVGDVKEFKIIEIDQTRKRISLSLKE